MGADDRDIVISKMGEAARLQFDARKFATSRPILSIFGLILLIILPSLLMLVVSRFTIKNRTEREATKEAEASAEVRQADNWTLTPVKERAAMSEREKELLRMAVIYAIANRDDVVEAFETEPGDQAMLRKLPLNESSRQLSVDGCVIDAPTEEEMSSLLKHF